MGSEKIVTKTVTGRIPVSDYTELRDFSSKSGVSLASLMENMLSGFAKSLRTAREGGGGAGRNAWAYADVDPKSMEDLRPD